MHSCSNDRKISTSQITVFNMECGIYFGKVRGEISKTLKRRCVDIYCLQEVRWKGQGAKRLEIVLYLFGMGVAKQKMVWV